MEHKNNITWNTQLSTPEFIKYCRIRGFHVTESDLHCYSGDKLLMPHKSGNIEYYLPTQVFSIHLILKNVKSTSFKKAILELEKSYPLLHDIAKTKQEGNEEIKHLKLDVTAHKQLQKRSALPKTAKTLLKRHRITKELLLDQIHSYAAKAHLNDDTGGNLPIVAEYVPQKILNQFRGTTRFAATCYEVVYDLYWIGSNGYKVFPALESMKYCTVCSKSFTPNRHGGKKQVTCGNKQCADTHRNRTKRLNRKK